jgi:hypothetical protein
VQAEEHADSRENERRERLAPPIARGQEDDRRQQEREDPGVHGGRVLGLRVVTVTHREQVRRVEDQVQPLLGTLELEDVTQEPKGVVISDAEDEYLE